MPCNTKTLGILRTYQNISKPQQRCHFWGQHWHIPANDLAVPGGSHLTNNTNIWLGWKGLKAATGPFTCFTSHEHLLVQDRIKWLCFSPSTKESAVLASAATPPFSIFSHLENASLTCFHSLSSNEQSEADLRLLARLTGLPSILHAPLSPQGLCLLSRICVSENA